MALGRAAGPTAAVTCALKAAPGREHLALLRAERVCTCCQGEAPGVLKLWKL